MIIEYIRYEVPDATQAEALLDAYRQAAPHLDAAPECQGFDVARGVEEPTHVVVRIEWSSRDAHERGFRAGPHFPPFLARIRAFIPMICEMKHYEPALRSGGPA